MVGLKLKLYISYNTIMSIVAAFLWQKSPTQSISTLIFDEDTLTVYSRPKKFTLSKKLFSFSRESKKIINNFSDHLIRLSTKYQKKITVEYKIVFLVNTISWMSPARESKAVLRLFRKAIKKIQKKHANIVLAPQLRRKLSGKSLLMFKRELRKLELVSRKRNTGYEYHLWAIALHATSTSYNKKLLMLRNALVNKYWNETI